MFLVLCLGALAVLTVPGSTATFSFDGRPIAVFDIEGMIVDSREFVSLLEEYARPEHVKAVVLRLNSPGGTVSASQEIYEAVRRFKAETSKKVVISMSSVAASGAYYIACAGDKIFANPGSITGSIGVIAEWYNYGELLQWAKVKSVVIKSGDLKDAGSPTRELTGEEHLYFQSLVSGMHDQFVAAVAEGRALEQDKVRQLADGRVYTGQEAKINGLIDELGTFQDALDAAAEMVGIAGKPKYVTPIKKKRSVLDLILGDMRALIGVNQDRSESHVRFNYLWR